MCAGTSTTELRAPRAGTIVGRGIGGERNVFWSGDRVRTHTKPWSVVDSDLTSASTEIAADGTYRLERLAPGDYTVYHDDGGSIVPSGRIGAKLQKRPSSPVA